MIEIVAFDKNQERHQYIDENNPVVSVTETIDGRDLKTLDTDISGLPIKLSKSQKASLVKRIKAIVMFHNGYTFTQADGEYTEYFTDWDGGYNHPVVSMVVKSEYNNIVRTYNAWGLE